MQPPTVWKDLVVHLSYIFKNAKNMSVLVGKQAPKFKASAVIDGEEIVENFSLDQYLGSKYVILFFYPKDFTFVCPTELHAFQEKLNEFKERDVEVVAVSTDTEQSHWGWLQLSKDDGGIKGITYPIVADTNKTISHNYDVLAGDFFYDEEGMLQAEGELVAYRGLFLIDKEGVVRHQIVNDLPLGRNVTEALRMVDALQFFEEKGEVCPANWEKGKEGMQATHSGVAEYLAAN
jgi:peroxiredoxin (alkyl hydroperoxide reductase subunit C)